MKKRSVRKMHLTRETLLSLETDQLHKAAGGSFRFCTAGLGCTESCALTDFPTDEGC